MGDKTVTNLKFIPENNFRELSVPAFTIRLLIVQEYEVCKDDIRNLPVNLVHLSSHAFTVSRNNYCSCTMIDVRFYGLYYKWISYLH